MVTASPDSPPAATPPVFSVSLAGAAAFCCVCPPPEHAVVNPIIAAIASANVRFFIPLPSSLFRVLLFSCLYTAPCFPKNLCAAITVPLPSLLCATTTIIISILYWADCSFLNCPFYLFTREFYVHSCVYNVKGNEHGILCSYFIFTLYLISNP